MLKKSDSESYGKALGSTLTRVADWLKFAEAKNAALLAFNSAWIVGLINLLSSDKALPTGFRTASALALPVFAIAAIIALASLLPRLRSDKSDTRFSYAEKLTLLRRRRFGRTAYVSRQCTKGALHA